MPFLAVANQFKPSFNQHAFKRSAATQRHIALRYGWRLLQPLLLCFIFCASVNAQTAAPGLIISVHAPAQQRGANHVVDLIALNPDTISTQYEFPAELTGTLHSGQRNWPVNLKPMRPVTAFTIPANQFVSLGYEFTLPAELGDALASLTVDRAPGVTVAVNVDDTLQNTEVANAKPTLEQQEAAAPPATTGIERTFANRFDFHEPMYFVYGSKAPAAKFQFSFKYRLIGKNSDFGDATPPFRGVYLAYTQRSLWDVNAKSSPFYDTSYMPELFFEWLAPKPADPDAGFRLAGLQTGLRHESNGKDGIDSRSLNIAYLRGAALVGSLRGWHGIIAPRVFALLDRDAQNRDITKYRGYGELQFTLQHGDDTQLSVISRMGTYKGKGSVQADITQPIRIPLINLETYLQLQYFYGYGESLLNYNQKSSIWRLGLGIVR